jgi:hypothetical protein
VREGVIAPLLVEVVVTMLTVNEAEAVSPVDPVTVTVKEPAPTLATTNEAAKAPPEIVHVEVPTTLPDKVQPVSLDENPVPETKTIDPA